MKTGVALALIGTLVGGCQKDSPAPKIQNTASGPGELNSEPNPKPKPKPKPMDTASLPGPTHVLLMGHADTEETARFLSIDLHKPDSRDSYTQPALARENWPGHYSAFAAVGQGQAFHPVLDKDGWHLAVRDLRAGKELPTIALEVEAVTALMAVGDDLFIGAGMSVGRMDLDDGRFEVLAERKSGFAGKAYDVFARDGRTVVAIDDVVTPIWADLFWPEGTSWKREPWTLPSFINGTYSLAAVHFDDADDKNGTLYAIGNYGIMSGSGHDLTRLAIVGGKLQVKENLILNAGVVADPPVLEEHINRRTDTIEKIIAGNDVTPWTGLALVKNKSGVVKEVAIAAGDRGLLIVPADFSHTSRARVVPLGYVHDIANIGGELIALVKGTKDGFSKVLWLGPDLSTSTSIELEGIYSRIVRDR